MITKHIWRFHLSLHNAAHPFEHIAHGGIIVLLLFVIKIVMSMFFLITFHISMAILVASFVLTTIGSLFAERKYLKKLRRRF